VQRASMKLMHPSGSVVAAAAALALVVGSGAGYAAGALPHHSVGGPQLKKNAVSTKKIKDHAVTGAKVAANSLTGAEIDESTLVIPNPSPSKAGVLTLSGYDFLPRGTTTWTTSGQGEVVTSSDGVLVAPLHLPSGTTITAITVFVEDGHPAAEISARLARYTPATGASEVQPPVPSVGSSPTIQALSLPVLQPTPGTEVDIVVGLPNVSSLKLWGAQVSYS
jgi:hypothetical protein